MATTTFANGTVVQPTWLNDVNDFVYDNVFNVMNSAYGATGNGSTNDAAAIQAALDAAETAGGGTVLLPWPSSYYYTGTTSLKIPNKVVLMGLGSPQVIAGGQQIKYEGTDAAIALKNGEVDTASRGFSVQNIGVWLNGGVAATGFRFRRCRDGLIQNCTVRLGANDQIGFHFMGERSGGTNQGVFDITATRLRSYDTAGTLTGIIHYKLTGTSNDGQCNGNSFFGLSAGGSGKFIQVGPSLSNIFVGLEMEVPGSSDDYIECLANATKNFFLCLYAGDAPVGYTGKIFNCAANADYNELLYYDAGSNVDPEDLTLTGDSTATSILGDKYVSSNTSRGYSLAVPGDAYRRLELRGTSLRYGDGATATLTPYAGPLVQTTNTLTLGASVAVNLDVGHSLYLNINAATNPTIAEPTGGYEGLVFSIEIINNSGGVQDVGWNAAFIKNTTLDTYTNALADAARFTCFFRKRGSQYVVIGTPLVM